MIKVCYVIGTLEIGGAERQLLKLIKNIDRTKFSPVLIALRSGALKEEFEKAVKAIAIGKKHKVDIFFLIRLITALKRERPDILHTFMFTSNTWGRIAGISAGVPVMIASERCVDVYKRRHHRLIDRILLRRTFCVAANSSAVKEFYQRTERIPESRITVIRNGVDMEEFKSAEPSFALKQELGIEKAEFIVGAGGRFTEQKGFMNLLKAVPAVLEKCRDAFFIFVGDGPLMDDFRSYAKEKKIERNIIFTGYRKDILRIFAQCGVIAVPSLFEGMPNVVLEAMALKKPVLGTDIPEISELVKDGDNGFLVPVKDNADAIAEKIILLYRNPGLCRSMGEKGHKEITERFSLAGMVRGYEKLYEEAIADSGRLRLPRPERRNSQ
ncbi:MAG: glycosyltransferase [Candidatus Omnitrophica bacterium]|nr:glycosyltransferase [Candidatus Omnitrophota bacterium]